MGLFTRLFRREKERELKKLSIVADQIEELEERYLEMTDKELANQTVLFKERYANGESLDELLPEAFAVVREASKRVLDMRHFYVQLIGGIVLHQGRIAEMKTGEGKTLVATLPAYLNALTGKGVHIVTVNDYLARRDADWMGKVFKFLGMSVGCILHDERDNQKKQEQYACDITYATNNEIGFDYLRDNMATHIEKVMQRGHHFAIIDEVDSILIDEARTPLIISAPAQESSQIYSNVQRFVRTLHQDDYVLDEKDKHIYLSEEGVARAERYFKIENLGEAENAELITKINSGLRANFLMSKDKDYIVENNEVIIVDEFTGRKMAGRRFSEGLHQAIEAKENVRIKKENKTIATITFQNLFRQYNKLSGMTGTAMTEEAEFKGIYNLDVVVIPTHLDMIRVDEPDKIYLTMDKKYEKVVEEIKKVYETRQPLLVGTIDVDVSEHISKMLKRSKVPHNVLNAKSNKEEAEIIAQAGRLGSVTIATNMAGRGTDIMLGGNPEYLARQKMMKEGFADELINIAVAYNVLEDVDEIKARSRFTELKDEFKEQTDKEKDEVKQLGGLRVLGTERHESRRIDNQLRGRSGRQGDEGSSCFYLSFEDELLRRFGGDRLKVMVGGLMRDEDAVIQMPIVSRQIEAAQKRCEDANFERRKYVLNYDDVMNKQRQLIYSQRNEVLHGADVHEQVLKYIPNVINNIIFDYVDFTAGDEKSIDYEGFNRALEQRVLRAGTNLVTEKLCGYLSIERISSAIQDEVSKQYEEKMSYAEENGIDFRSTERNVLLNQVDKHWMDHIDAMDVLRKGIGLRGYGHKDPVLEYRREGFEMFDDMIDSIQNSVAIILCKLDVHQAVERRNAFIAQQNAIKSRVTVRNEKQEVGRNSPCPCGSGRKYKHCCGG